MRLFLFSLLVISSNAYKILVYNSKYAHSHSNFLGTIADILVDAGHNVLRAEKYDVVILENFDMCGVGYSHLLQPKSLITTSASIPFSWMYHEFGMPLSLSFNPSSFTSSMDGSFWSRLKNIYAEFLMHLWFYPARWMVEDVFQERFGPSFPSLEQISSHAAYTLFNTEPLIDFAVPTLNRIVSIGGLSAKQPAPIGQEWDEILSRRPKTVLFSLGSVVKSIFMPEEYKKSIVKTFARFPDVTFIWKYENPEDDFAKEALRVIPNLHLTKWMPQNDLLADERITAFITHGGMGSAQETAVRGKPGIFIPIFADQPRNAGMMEFNGFGKVLDKFDLINPDIFEAAIRDVLTNDSYRKNAERVSAMLAKKPFNARELLIKTVEFAAEYGPSPALRPQSHDMSIIQYHNLDIFAAGVAFSALTAMISMKLVSVLLSLCKFSVKSKTD